MKKIFALLLTCALAAGLAVGAAGAAVSEDAVIDDWAVEEVRAAYETGLVPTELALGNDYTAPITRGQFARLAVELAAKAQGKTVRLMLHERGVELSTEPPVNGLPPVVKGTFLDTRDAAVELAASLGIASGFEDMFRPNDTLTRVEAASMIKRTLETLSITDPNTPPMEFLDAWAIPDWGREAVRFISGRTESRNIPLMTGDAGSFLPLDTLSIEQAVIILRRALDSTKVTGAVAGWREMADYEHVEIKLTFAGDCTFGRGHNFGYRRSFDEMWDLVDHDPYYFFSGVPHFFDDDMTMVNFEGTLTEATQRAIKEFVFKGPAEYAQILPAGSIDVVSIANNHSHDYLDVGYEDTLLNLEPVVTVAGYEIRPIVNVKGVNVGIVSLHQMTWDEEIEAEIDDAIYDLRSRGADIIIFAFHWGTEARYRSNRAQQNMGRHCIDMGADLVIGHHPHVVQEVEEYNGKTIVYSLGNFCFGGNQNPNDKDCLVFRQSYTFNLVTRQIEAEEHEAIPYSISSVSWRNDYHPVPRELRDAPPPVEEAPVEETPVEEAPAEEAPVEEVPTEE